MYGPAPHSSQVALSVSPGTTALCVTVGILISSLALSRRFSPATRAWLFCFGQTVLLTAPLALVMSQGVYGDFPTIDKAGSFLYYQDGVHIRSLLHPMESLNDCAVQLIGVHMGHLWITQFFDLFLQDYGPFNAQALLYPALAWWAAALFFREVGASWRGAVALAFPYGMCLHVFRDLNWYTIEKAAIFLIPLYALSLLKAHRNGGSWTLKAGLVFVLCAWVNWYLALVAAAGAGFAAIIARSKNLWKATGLSAALLLPLVLYQLALVNQGSPGSPEDFLELRAAMDRFSIVPLEWNRLEWYAALSPLAIGLGAHRLWTGGLEPLERVLLGVAAGLFVFSLGPYLVGDLPNPIYMMAWHVVPGFWRVAKPEVFFYGTWICVLAVASKNTFSEKRIIYPGMVILWLVFVRQHAAFPGFSQYNELVPALCNHEPHSPASTNSE